MDTAALARLLGISPTAVRNRASNLGLVPNEISNGKSRPKVVWTEDQVQQICNYGQTPNPDSHENLVDDSEQSGQLALGSTQSQLATALQGQLNTLDTQCETVEDQMAVAIAARVAMVVPRSFQKANQLLQSGAMGIDFAGFSAIALTPRVKNFLGDRFPAEV